jgi:hypothetical protein
VLLNELPYALKKVFNGSTLKPEPNVDIPELAATRTADTKLSMQHTRSASSTPHPVCDKLQGADAQDERSRQSPGRVVYGLKQHG